MAPYLSVVSFCIRKEPANSREAETQINGKLYGFVSELVCSGCMGGSGEGGGFSDLYHTSVQLTGS